MKKNEFLFGESYIAAVWLVLDFPDSARIKFILPLDYFFYKTIHFTVASLQEANFLLNYFELDELNDPQIHYYQLNNFLEEFKFYQKSFFLINGNVRALLVGDTINDLLIVIYNLKYCIQFLI